MRYKGEVIAGLNEKAPFTDQRSSLLGKIGNLTAREIDFGVITSDEHSKIKVAVAKILKLKK